ncbi:MAG: class I SAM-dependent methyltransferase, partial [Polyangiaceae bacterium]|nr:class I SAM-dependent methyltransferase [Polyangiaceae bacterium]
GYAPELFYPVPTSALQVERLYTWFDHLVTRRDVPGDVVEVGCYLGGTSALSWRLLQRTQQNRRYICVDTFSGFVASQFARDVELDTPARMAHHFSRSSKTMVQRLMKHYGAGGIELIEGDIAELPVNQLPEPIALCLLDVDLEVPTYAGLQRLAPRLAPGGVILVDDCPEETDWKGARIGYERYMAEAGLTPQYTMGMGILESTNS